MWATDLADCRSSAIHREVRPYELIKAKRDGKPLAPDDIRAFIDGYTRGVIPDYQMSAMCMAIFFRGLSRPELGAWARAMLESGEVLDLSETPGVKVDKHSTGGVGDKVSLSLAPLAAACGVPVPMISGRGLGHTGGTLDKLESIPGFRVDLSVERYRAARARGRRVPDRPDRDARARGQEALRAARRHRDRRLHPAHRRARS